MNTAHDSTALDSPWIQTFTGRRFYPLNPSAEDVYLEDIAHALSMKCRFTGHCKQFYSVAEHCVRMAHHAKFMPPMFRPIPMSVAALLHDAAEAYLPDVAAPLKMWFYTFHGKYALANRSIYMSAFCEVESNLLRSIRHGLGYLFYPLKSFYGPELNEMDRRMLATEARDLMGDVEDWKLPYPPYEDRIETTMTPVEAKAAFLETAATLGIKDGGAA